MSDSSAKLPFVLTLKWSVQWAIAVVLRHQLIVSAFMAAGAIVGLVSFVAPTLGSVLWLVLGIASIALALLTHNEVLHGTAQLDASLLGPSGGRVFTYFLDCVVLAAIMLVLIFVPTVLVVGFAVSDGGDAVTVIVALAAMVLFFASIVLTSRLALRLPSRALGQPMPWGDVWALGKGDTLKLVLAPVVLSLPFIIVGVIAEMVSVLLGDMVQMVLFPLQVVLSCAFLSVAYGRLRAMHIPEV